MKRILNSWLSFVALVATPTVITFVLMFGLHWRMFPPILGYPIPLPLPLPY